MPGSCVSQASSIKVRTWENSSCLGLPRVLQHYILWTPASHKNMWDRQWWHTCTYTYPHTYQQKQYMTQAGNLTTWLFRRTEGKTAQQYIMCPPLSGINRKARTSEIMLSIPNSIQNIGNITSIWIQQTGLLQYLWWQHTMGHLLDSRQPGRENICTVSSNTHTSHSFS